MPNKAPEGLSPGLSQLLNAALIDRAFCAELLRSPVEAARRLSINTPKTLGTNLPDWALKMESVVLSESDLSVLRALLPCTSLEQLAQEFRRLSALF